MNDTASPPTPLLSDYVEMAYLSLMVLLGIPLNLFILKRLLHELKRTPSASVRGGFLLLKINLNISDLLLLLMAIGKISWLNTYEWVFGDSMCRIYQYMSMFALYVSSNIVVCIAIDRLRNVMGANKLHSGQKHLTPIKIMICGSWLAAVFCSLPQLVVFETVNVFPSIPGGWTQCSDVWQIYGYSDSFLMNSGTQDAYNISHLIIVFWGPLTVLIVSYVWIATKLMQYALKGGLGESNRVPHVAPTMVERTVIEEQESMVANDCQIESGMSKARSWFGSKSVDAPPLIQKKEGLGVLPQFLKRKSDCGGSRQPVWRRQLRSKVFRTTLLVILTHFLFWLPYNLLSLMQYVSPDMHRSLSDHANIFKDLQIVITLINPFLYGFS